VIETSPFLASGPRAEGAARACEGNRRGSAFALRDERGFNGKPPRVRTHLRPVPPRSGLEMRRESSRDSAHQALRDRSAARSRRPPRDGHRRRSPRPTPDNATTGDASGDRSPHVANPGPPPVVNRAQVSVDEEPNRALRCAARSRAPRVVDCHPQA